MSESDDSMSGEHMQLLGAKVWKMYGVASECYKGGFSTVVMKDQELQYAGTYVWKRHWSSTLPGA